MRISDWSSDVCSSDLHAAAELGHYHVRLCATSQRRQTKRQCHVDRRYRLAAIIDRTGALSVLAQQRGDGRTAQHLAPLEYVKGATRATRLYRKQEHSHAVLPRKTNRPHDPSQQEGKRAQ